MKKCLFVIWRIFSRFPGLIWLEIKNLKRLHCGIYCDANFTYAHTNLSTFFFMMIKRCSSSFFVSVDNGSFCSLFALAEKFVKGLCDNYVPQWWGEFIDELSLSSWVGCLVFTKRFRAFFLFAENCQILLKIYFIPIVNNQLNSSLWHIVVTNACFNFCIPVCDKKFKKTVKSSKLQIGLWVICRQSC